MTNTILIDSDVLIDFSRQRPDTLDWFRLAEAETTVIISDITRMELFVGARDQKDLNAINRMLHRFKRLPVSETISTRAVDLVHQYRLSHGLLIPDALIAASALTLDISLATRNHRDFQFIDGLRLASGVPA
ncbi:Ribonuclease VapC [Gammaproteobacteria bacterium]